MEHVSISEKGSSSRQKASAELPIAAVFVHVGNRMCGARLNQQNSIGSVESVRDGRSLGCHASAGVALEVGALLEFDPGVGDDLVHRVPAAENHPPAGLSERSLVHRAPRGLRGADRVWALHGDEDVAPVVVASRERRLQHRLCPVHLHGIASGIQIRQVAESCDRGA
jgi:hypothetical protein